MPTVAMGGEILTLPPGAEGSHPKLDPNFQLFSCNHLAFWCCETGSDINYFYATPCRPATTEHNVYLRPGLPCQVAGQ